MHRPLMDSRSSSRAARWLSRVSAPLLSTRGRAKAFLGPLLTNFTFGSAAASGDMQTYQIRTTPSATSLPQTVVMTSPVTLTPQTTKTDDPQLKREIRLMKNRYIVEHIPEWVRFLHISKQSRVTSLDNRKFASALVYCVVGYVQWIYKYC